MAGTTTPRSTASNSLPGILRSWLEGFEIISSRPPAPMRTSTDTATRVAAWSPTWRCSNEGDSGRRPTEADIATEHWDLLFRSALKLLERVAAEKPAAPDDTGVRLQAPGTALRECLEALDQLRRAVPAPV